MKAFFALLICVFVAPAFGQDRGAWLSSLPEAKDYVQKRTVEL